MKLRQLRSISLRYALACAVLYGVLAALWIHFSTEFSRSSSASLAQMQQFETVKGYLFVAVTSLLFFVFSLTVFKRISSSGQKLIANQRRLVQAERDAVTSVISASIAHDLSNVLTVLRLHTERLKNMAAMPEKAEPSLSALDRSVTRMSELAARMRTAGEQLVNDRPRAYDVGETIDEALAFLKGHGSVQHAKIRVELARPLITTGYSILVHQLVMNLVLNAAEATEGRGHVLVKARSEGSAISIEVHDDGPGIPVASRKKIFEAFHTTKKYGTGLGLVSVQSCVEIHGGGLSIGESSLGGTAFRVTLPDLDETRVRVDKMSESLNKTTAIELTQFHS